MKFRDLRTWRDSGYTVTATLKDSNTITRLEFFWNHNGTCCTCTRLLSEKKAGSRRLDNLLAVGRHLPWREVSTISQQRIWFVISTSSYVKLVEMMVSKEWEDSFFGDRRNSLLHADMPKTMATMMWTSWATIMWTSWQPPLLHSLTRNESCC